jgi:hypothetical protein
MKGVDRKPMEKEDNTRGDPVSTNATEGTRLGLLGKGSEASCVSGSLMGTFENAAAMAHPLAENLDRLKSVFQSF